MTRRNGVGFGALGILACLAVLLVAGCSGYQVAQEEAGAQPAAPTRPNIIFIVTDDLDFASAHRLPQLRSSLLEEGASLENAFVSYPLCCPSRATILTGLYAHNHEVKSNKPPNGGFQKFYNEGLEEDTIAVSLQQSGYKTAFFGKYLNHYPGDAGRATYVTPGWDEWYFKRNANHYYDYRITENGETVSYGSEPEDYYTDVLSEQATAFIRHAASDSKPFFMYVAPTAVHETAKPAERHEGTFTDEEAPRPPSFNEEDVSDKPSEIRDRERILEEEASAIDHRYRQRLETMLAVDEMVASLVEELDATGELDSTFLFFTSDNGYHLGEHRIGAGKNLPYEESARVPLFVRGPGVPAGLKVEKLALNTDLAPTFADLAGVDFPADGRSLAPLLRSEDRTWRSAILLETYPKGEGDEASEEEDDEEDEAGVYEAIRTETHKYVEYANGERELYDLEADPYELESLHEAAEPALVESLRKRLEALKACSGRSCQDAEGSPY